MFKGMIGRMPGMSSGAAARYVDSGRGASKRFMKKGQDLLASGHLKPSHKQLGGGMHGPMSPSRANAESVRDYAIRRRQRQVGTRYAMGAAAIAAPIGARPGSNESRTSYRGPMQTGRGVGRYA